MQGVRPGFEPEATSRLAVNLDHGHGARTKPPVKFIALPCIVPSPGLFDDLAHARAVKIKKELAIGFDRVAEPPAKRFVQSDSSVESPILSSPLSARASSSRASSA